MQQEKQSLFEKAFDPIYQALICFGGVLIIGLIGKLLQLSGLMDISDRFPWMTAASFMLFFALFNSVFSLSAKNAMQYWGRSIYSFLGLAIASGLIAWLFSSLTINEAGSYRWIYIVLTIGYLVFLSIVNLMKRIVEFAQREEWNHPRLRNRKRK